MQLLHLAILSPFLFAFIISFLAKYAKRVHTGWFVLILPVLLFIYFLPMIRMTQSGETLRSVLEWIPSLGINFTVYIDGTRVIIRFTDHRHWLFGHSLQHFLFIERKRTAWYFYVYLLMFMGAMLGVVLVDNVMVLYMFWELTSLSSFLLIGYWYKREKSRYGAAKSLLITVSGGLCMLGGFILLYLITDSFSIREMVHQVQLIAGTTNCLSRL
nr:proton-conducting transporter membrane subunit [Bacillus subtilis]